MKSTRKSIPLPTDTELHNALRGIEQLGLSAHIVTNNLAREKARLDEQYKILKDQAAAELKDIAENRAPLDDLVQRWSEHHEERFGRNRSLELFGVRFGWRTGQSKTVLIKPEGEKKKQTLKGLLAALQKLGPTLRDKFVRNTPTVNKDGIIEHFDQHRQLLEARGVTVDQDTVFYTDPIAATKEEKTIAA